MGELTRREIYELGLLAARIGLTSETLEGAIILGATAYFRGITRTDIEDIWRIKMRSASGES